MADVKSTAPADADKSHDAAAAPASSDSWGSTSTFTKWRILTSFCIFGLSNNFGYVVMLTAAYDILGDAQHNGTIIDGCLVEEYAKPPYKLLCHTIGTGAILLADILPCVLIKIGASFVMHRVSYNIRILVCILSAASSFVITGLGALYHVTWISIIGVAVCSFACGLGEIVFLSFTSNFNKSTFSAWSCGTGVAGIAASFAYTGLTQAGFTPATTLFIMLFVPSLQALSFYALIVKPYSVEGWAMCNYNQVNSGEKEPVFKPDDRCNDLAYGSFDQEEDGVWMPNDEKKGNDEQSLLPAGGQTNAEIMKNNYTFPEMLKLTVPLLKFMIPLYIVFVAEYYINQALIELLYFPASCSVLTISQQYRWMSTTYQLGVFLSRTSIVWFQWRHIWIFPLLQLGNVAILQSQVLLHFMPSNGGMWIVFTIIIWEGLLGGLVYVNSFYRISSEVVKEYREFSMGVGSTADSLGITTGALISILLHDKICELDIVWT